MPEILPVFNGQKNQPAVNLKLHRKRRPAEQRELRRRPRIQQKFARIIFWLIAATTLYWIPIPGLGSSSASSPSSYSMGNLSISPYLSASSIISILSATVLRKEREEKGDYGATKLLQYTRYACVAISIVSSIYIALAELKPITLGWNSRQLFVVVSALTAGSVLLMVFVDMISRENLGTGISVFIAVSLGEGFVGGLKAFYEATRVCDPTIVTATVITVLGSGFFLVYGATGLGSAYTLVALRSLKSTSRPEASLATLPIAISYLGVGALSGANSLIGLASLTLGANNIFNKFGGGAVTLLTALLSLPVTVIGSLETFKPSTVSKTLQNSDWVLLDDNATVIRPGDPTTKYLTSRVNQAAMTGGLLLAVLGLISAIPAFVLSSDNEVAASASSLLDLQSVIGLTSALVEVKEATDVYALERLYTFSN